MVGQAKRWMAERTARAETIESMIEGVAADLYCAKEEVEYFQARVRILEGQMAALKAARTAMETLTPYEAGLARVKGEIIRSLCLPED